MAGRETLPLTVRSNKRDAKITLRGQRAQQRASWKAHKPSSSRGLDANTHGTGGASNDLHGGLNVVSVEVGHLDLGDFAELIEGQRAHGLSCGMPEPLLIPSFLYENSRRRSLAHEGEGLVLIDGDFNRDDGAGLLLRSGVERLAELHDVDTLSTQSGADRRSRVSLTGRNLQLDEAGLFLFSHSL